MSLLAKDLHHFWYHNFTVQKQEIGISERWDERASAARKSRALVVAPTLYQNDVEEPLLPKVSKDDFCQNVEQMVQSGEDWQLITTFNKVG